MSRVCVLLATHWGAMKGGAEIQAHYFADYIAKETEHEVFYLGRWVPEGAEAESFAYPIAKYEPPGLFSSLKFGQTLDSYDIYRQLQEIKPDVILQLAAGAITGVGAFYADRNNVPFVWYIASDQDVDPVPNVGTRSPARFADRVFYRYGIRQATRIVAQTSVQVEMLRANYGREADAVIQNFHPAPAHIDKSANEVVVSWVANLKPLKQPQLFVDLARSLADRQNVRFVMAGRPDPEQEGVYEALSREVGNFEYLGELSMEEANELLDKSHLFVNTSEYEGFPNTFVQAWLRAVPTLSINVDPDDLLASEGLGQQCHDMPGLCAAVGALIDDPERREAMGARARDYAIEHFSMGNADRLLRLLIDSISQYNQ